MSRNADLADPVLGDHDPSDEPRQASADVPRGHLGGADVPWGHLGHTDLAHVSGRCMGPPCDTHVPEGHLGGTMPSDAAHMPRRHLGNASEVPAAHVSRRHLGSTSSSATVHMPRGHLDNAEGTYVPGRYLGSELVDTPRGRLDTAWQQIDTPRGRLDDAAEQRIDTPRRRLDTAVAQRIDTPRRRLDTVAERVGIPRGYPDPPVALLSELGDQLSTRPSQSSAPSVETGVQSTSSFLKNFNQSGLGSRDPKSIAASYAGYPNLATGGATSATEAAGFEMFARIIEEQGKCMERITKMALDQKLYGPAECGQASTRPDPFSPMGTQLFAATPQNTTFGMEDLKVPSFLYEPPEAGSRGSILCHQLRRLGEMRRDLREYVQATHVVPPEDGGQHFEMDIAQCALREASELFQQYIMCPHEVEKKSCTPDTIKAPHMHLMTQVYLRRVFPPLRAAVPQSVRDVVPTMVWDMCGPYQALIGLIFCLHRRLDVQYPADAKAVIRCLQEGPFANGLTRTQGSLEDWWLTIEQVNTLRPGSSGLTMSLHSVANCLDSVVGVLCSESHVSGTMRFRLTELAVQCNLDAWEIDSSKLVELYSVLHHCMGLADASLEAQTQEAPHGLCRAWFKGGRCRAGDSCTYLHDPGKRGKAADCPLFPLGRCPFGSSCWLMHRSQPKSPETQYGPSEDDAAVPAGTEYSTWLPASAAREQLDGDQRMPSHATESTQDDRAPGEVAPAQQLDDGTGGPDMSADECAAYMSVFLDTVWQTPDGPEPTA